MPVVESLISKLSIWPKRCWKRNCEKRSSGKSLVRGGRKYSELHAGLPHGETDSATICVAYYFNLETIWKTMFYNSRNSFPNIFVIILFCAHSATTKYILRFAKIINPCIVNCWIILMVNHTVDGPILYTIGI